MNKKKSGNLFVWIFAIVALFLAVPFIFQEEVLKKSSNSIYGDSSLPIIGEGENPISKYFKKFASFYGLNKKDKKTTKNSFDMASAKDVGYDSEQSASGGSLDGILDVSASKGLADNNARAEDALEAMRSSYSRSGATTSEDGTIISRSGLSLKPEAEGYYYGGKFYKNGAYPSLKNKKEIETALSRFHKDMAAKQGLSAAYVKSADGSLRVKYVPQNVVDNKDNPLFAYNRNSGDGYYDNARIISRAESGQDFSPSYSGGRNSSGRVGDVGAVYGDVSNKIKDHFISSTPGKPVEPTNPISGKDNNLSAELISKSSPASGLLLRSSDSKDDANVPPEDYKNAPAATLVFSDGGVEEFLKRYEIDASLEGMKNILIPLPKGSNSQNMQNMNEAAVKKIQDAVTKKVKDFQEHAKGEKVKIFSPFAPLQNIGGNTGSEDNIFFAYPRTPYVKVDGFGQPEVSEFSEVFLKRSGIEPMFDAMGVDSGSMADLKERYKKLDTARRENNKYLQVIANNEAVKKRVPKVVFYLGKSKTNENNVVVSSPSSFLYVYAPNMAPDFVAKGKHGQSYQEMSADNFINNINAKNSNNIVVVNNSDVIDTLKKSGVKTVVYVEPRVLSSGTPANVTKVLEELKKSVTGKIMSDVELSKAFVEAMKVSDKKEKQK